MPKLFMLLIGCTPQGRHTEQHDVFFGIGENVSDLIPEIKQFWPEAKGKMHIDGWRTVTNVNDQTISVISKVSTIENPLSPKLFFINLGGYKPNEFEEFHYKMLTVAATKGDAVKVALQTAFYKHTSLPGPGTSHIDNRYGVDVDDFYAIKDILPEEMKQQFCIEISNTPVNDLKPDELHLGYLKWTALVN